MNTKTECRERGLEATMITHRRWLLGVGIMLGLSIGVGVTHVMPYTWWSYAVIIAGIAAVFAEMGAAVWWFRVVSRLDELARSRQPGPGPLPETPHDSESPHR